MDVQLRFQRHAVSQSVIVITPRALWVACWLLCAMTLRATALQAQLVVSRGLMRPIASARPDAQSPRLVPWAEFQRAATSDASVTGWNYKLGLDIDLARLPRGFRLSGALGHEMAAAPSGGLGFDPQGAIWSEALVLSAPVLRGWTFAYHAFLRCRHSIDATEAVTDGEGVIVLPGAQLSVTSPSWKVGSVGSRVVTARVGAIAESYSKPTDKRRPKTAGGPLWNDAADAFGLTAVLLVPAWDEVQLGARLWHSAVRFVGATPAIRSNARYELGLRVPSATRATDVLVAYERTFDDMLLAAPRATRAVLFGVRLTSTETPE